jgi:hypothetical protein
MILGFEFIMYSMVTCQVMQIVNSESIPPGSIPTMMQYLQRDDVLLRDRVFTLNVFWDLRRYLEISPNEPAAMVCYGKAIVVV